MSVHLVRYLDNTTKYGLLLLLIWTPLAFGAVHAWAYALLQVHVFVLVALWLGRDLLARPPLQPSGPFIFTSLAWPLALFLLLLLVQILPLPAPILQWVSPTAADLYRQFLPDWPNTTATLSLQPYLTRMAIGQWLAFAGIFFMVVNVIRTPQQIRLICWTIVGIACLMALLGIMQRMSATNEIYWSRDTSYAGQIFFGPFVNKNHFAGYQIIALFLGLGLLLSQPSFRQQSRTHSAWRKRLFGMMSHISPERLLLVVVLATMSGALFLSNSRGGTLGFMLGLIPLSLFLRCGHLKLKRQALLALVVVAMIGMGIWLGITPLLRSLESTASSETVLGLAGRLPIFQTAWGISKDFPLLGIGYDTFAVISARYQPALKHSLRFIHVHNDFLQLLVETGWVGFSILMAGILLFLKEIIRKWRSRHDPFVQIIVATGLSAIIAMGLHSLVDFNLHVPSNALLFTIVLALTYAAANLPSQRAYPPVHETEDAVTDDGPATRRTKRVLLPALGILSALGLAMMTTKIAVADLLYPQQEVLQTNHWVYTAEPSIRYDRLQQALKWTPHNPYYWRSLADLEAQTARATFATENLTPDAKVEAVASLESAVADYRRALGQEPTVPDTQLGWLQAMQLLASFPSLSPRSDGHELSTWYTKIASLAPLNPVVQYNLGAILLSVSRPETMTIQSRFFFGRAIELEANYADAVLQAYRYFLPDDEALRRFASSIPNTIQGHLQAAKLLEPLDWTQSRLHYRMALFLSDSDPELLKAYGEALHRHHSFAVAQDIWQRLLELTPDDAAVYLNLATAQAKLNAPERAARTLEQLVARFPRHPKYLTSLAEHYMKEQLPDEAERIWKRTIDLEPRSVHGYVGLAKVYILREEFADAIRTMQRVVNLGSSHVSHHYQLASLFQRIGKPEKAEQVYLGLTRTYSTAPHAFYMLGQLAQQDGNLKLAASYYRRAVSLEPKQASYQQAVKTVLAQIKHN